MPGSGCRCTKCLAVAGVVVIAAHSVWHSYNYFVMTDHQREASEGVPESLGGALAAITLATSGVSMVMIHQTSAQA